MKLAPRTFFALSALTFVAAAGFSVWRLLPDARCQRWRDELLHQSDHAF